ncbi:DUF5691 domain-containing protein [Pedobacter sp. UBA5917]|jgi:hypothetical protein|uniref:DUF5691 domain-containing protein n=1 Tax=Pedobacter sp. UBA5917 TaxID=1947061 RepID=UPI0025D1E456|nr:DUF5691 domain-containing protein [Pedobacter sp. UBA5917]
MSDQNIIKTALLGTDKVQFDPIPDLSGIGNRIIAEQVDKEDAFLKNAAVNFLYNECGRIPRAFNGSQENCPDEEKTELDVLTGFHIRSALQLKDDVLFYYLIYRTNQANKIFGADLVPDALNKALSQKKKAEAVLTACGETGKWLAGINKNWSPLYGTAPSGEDWETGNLEWRLNYFASLRTESPSDALALLSDLQQENANTRAEFIALLEINLSINDEAFLMSVLTDKSKKVKDIAVYLLKLVPGTAINQLFLDYLLKILSVKEERVLLIAKKKVLAIDQGITPGEELFKYGLEKISSEKGVDDAVFWVAQIFGFIDVATLASKFNLSVEEWLKLVLGDKHAGVFKPFLKNAAIHFKDELLSKKLLESGIKDGIELLKFVNPKERIIFIKDLLETDFNRVLDLVLESYDIIETAIAERIFKKLSDNPYVIQTNIYQKLALSMPDGLLSLLKKYETPVSDQYQVKYFSNQVAGMIRYIELRQTLKF